MKRITTLIAAATLALATSAAPAAAHEKDVDPPGRGDGHDATVVSQGWAQAHCHAAAPAQATARSGGVVTFSPDGALPCPATPNPGDQVHPHGGG